MEGHLIYDHVIVLAIPPKHNVSEIVGYLIGKSTIEIARRFGKVRKITGESFWVRGYFMNTVGIGGRNLALHTKSGKKHRRKEQFKLL
ncbi:transposase [uncultured Bilophila sp.]|uniref:transposase n=1 Tax=uncultured Bilophila sp. TaxID=529385 RepID=UPI0035A68A3B